MDHSYAFLGATVASAALKSTLVLAAAAIGSLLMRRRSAAARHLLWLAAAVAVIAIPLISVAIPALRIPAPQVIEKGAAIFRVTSKAVADGVAGGSLPQGAARHSTPVSRVNWTAWMIGIWSVGTVLGLLHMLAAYAALWRVRKNSAPVADHEGISIRESGEGMMPMTAGILKPAVFLPRDASDWPEERRRAVLLHEIAHVRRGDAAAQVIARLALAVYWWNPLEWFAWREFIQERERAADDFVLASGVNAADYAAHLLEIARAITGEMKLSGAVAMARRSQLEGRLMAILDSNRSRRAASRLAVWITAACAVAVIIPLAAVRAQDDAQSSVVFRTSVQAAVAQRDTAALENLAGEAAKQGKLDVSRQILETTLKIIGEAAGTTSPEYGHALLKLADLTDRQSGLKDAAPLYSQAADLLSGKPESAAPLVKLGIAAILNKDLEGAYSDFDRAQAADPSKTGVAMQWKANVRARQGMVEEADGLYKTAIAAQKPGSLEEAMALDVYAQFLKSQGRNDEAKAAREQASSVYASNRIAASMVPRQWNGADAIKMSPGVTPPKVISKVEPEYSQEARAAQLWGTSILSVVIGTDGMAHDIQVVQTLGMGLDAKAVQAVSQWQFQPAEKDGQPVPVIATIEVNFRLL